jgi:hypothetical protein
MASPDKVSVDQEVEIDRDGLRNTLCFKGAFIYCVGCIFGAPCIYCYSNSQTVTVSDTEVMLKYDLSICGNKERHIPMDRIQDVTLSAGFCEKICGTENVGIQTAGGGGPEAEIVIMAPKEPAMVRDLILANRSGKSSSGDGLGGDATPLLTGTNPLVTGNSPDLKELKDSVLRIEKLVGNGVNKMNSK